MYMIIQSPNWFSYSLLAIVLAPYLFKTLFDQNPILDEQSHTLMEGTLWWKTTPKSLLEPKNIFLPKIILTQNFFWIQNIFRTQNFFQTPIFFGPNMFLDRLFFWPKIFLNHKTCINHHHSITNFSEIRDLQTYRPQNEDSLKLKTT